MRKKKFIILAIMICLFISFSIVTYAYFIKKIEGGTHGISSSPDDSQVVEVSDYNEFIKEVRLYDALDSEYNSDSDISESTRRKTIKFVDNIRLKSDLLIDADCNLDLNNYLLDLGGFDIVFRYRFDGLYFIYGGTIDDTSILDEEGNSIPNATPGSIIIDCPKQNVNFDESIINENTNIKITYATDEQIAISAMNMILSNIQDIGINDFYNIKNTVDSATHQGCNFTHDNGTMCVYTYTDLDLINNYFNYEGLEITYSSSNKEVLSDKGNVYIPSSNQTSDLTITVSYNNCEPIVKVVSVHILVKNNDYLNAGNIILQKYLSRYYDADLQALQFDTSFLLPKNNSYLGVTYSYELKTASSDSGITSDEGLEYFDNTTYDDYYLVSLSSEITGIEVTSSKGGTTITTDTIPVNGESTTIIDDNHSYAVNIARMLYNNQIFIREESNETGYTQYDDILIDPNEHGYTRIESISNRLINNNEGTYQLLDFPESSSNFNKYQILQVDKENETLPYIGQSVFLEITFNFKAYYDGDVIVVQVPIIYEPPKDSGQSFPAFDPYYVYFDKEFSKANSNYSYESFTMPLSYDGNKVNPIYTFVVFGKTENGFEKLNDGELFTQSITNGSYLDFTQNTLMNVTINPYYIDSDTKEYYFAYVPTYLNSTGNGVYYYDPIQKTTVQSVSDVTINIENYPYLSVLTVPGIVRYQSTNSVKTEAFADKEFYIMAYNLLSYDTYEEGKFLLKSNLENHVESIDFSTMSNFKLNGTDTDGQIDSLKGINLMKGINVLNFEGKALDTNGTQFATELGYISEITNLKILNLASTNIYDCTMNDFAMPNDDNNNFLDSLSKLTNLEELYLQKNKIVYFTALANFAALKKVDISNNSFEATTTITFLKTPMTNLANSLYGTFGANNISPITTLETKDVEVIKGTGSENTLQQEFIDIVNALSSLQYQDRLDGNVSMADILALYPSGTSTNLCLIYDIPQSFALTNNDDIAFKFVSIVLTENDNGFTMQINYDWEQVGLFGEDGSISFTYEYRIARY